MVLVLVVAVVLCSQLTEVSGVSSTIQGSWSGDDQYREIFGPFALSGMSNIDLLIRAKKDVELVLLSEKQAAEANHSYCYPPALARYIVKTLSETWTLYQVPPGIYRVGMLWCNRAVGSVFDYTVRVTVAAPDFVVAVDFAVTRFRWWINSFYFLVLLLYGFTSYSLHTPDLRVYWLPFGALVVTKMILIIVDAALSIALSVPSVVYWQRYAATESLWRAAVVGYMHWVYIGSYLMGAHFQIDGRIRWISRVVASLGALLPVLCFWNFSDCSGFRVLSTLVVLLSFWFFCLFVVLRHMRTNKVVLDARVARAANHDDELLKRVTLRLMRGSCMVGAFLYSMVLAIQLGNSSVVGGAPAVEEVMIDGSCLVALGSVVIGLIANVQSRRFIDVGAAANRRRQVFDTLRRVASLRRRRNNNNNNNNNDNAPELEMNDIVVPSAPPISEDEMVPPIVEEVGFEQQDHSVPTRTVDLEEEDIVGFEQRDHSVPTRTVDQEE